MQPHYRRRRTSLLWSMAVAVPFAVLPVGARPSSALVASWDYLATMEFQKTTFNAGAGVPTAGPNAITWSDPNSGNQSILRITNSPVSGIAFTNSAIPAPGPRLEFVNQPIALTSATLANTILHFELALLSLDPLSPGPVSLAANFSLAFAETGDTGACLISSPTPCPDILVLGGGVSSAPFVFAGDSYVIQFVAPALGPLPAAACAAAGVVPPCVGKVAEENTIDIDPDFRILRLPVPVPPTLMFVGLGLLGLSLARHRD